MLDTAWAMQACISAKTRADYDDSDYLNLEDIVETEIRPIAVYID